MTTAESGSEIPTWAETRVNSVDKLRDRLEATAKENKGALAWRGHARAEWSLETTLDRRLQEVAAQESYEQWLGREQAVIHRFKQEARAYASETEERYLQDT